MYEVGVAYFERSGVVNGRTRLPVPEGHLDDALKSLVVLSASGKTGVEAIQFPARVSSQLSRSLAGLKDTAPGALDLQTLVGSLVGADVEVRTAKQAVKGKLMAMVPAAHSEMARCRTVADGKTHCEKASSVVVLQPSGELQRFALQDIDSIKPLSAERVAKLRAAGTALGSASGHKDVSVITSGTGPVSLGYIAEAPVWRPSYRLVLGPDKATLQGWALIHNDGAEAWKKVRVELVNGRPDSFLYPLAAARYVRRALVVPKQQLSTVPQALDGPTDDQWDDNDGESYGAGGLGVSGVGEGGGGRGEGIGLGTVGTVGHGAGGGDGASESSVLSVGNLAGTATQEGVESGAQFTYTLAKPVDLGAHSSALLPFVQSQISAKRIALFPWPGDAARSAVRLRNETGQTLPGGGLAVFAGGGLAGETLLDRMKPKEVQFLTFGNELDVSATELGSSDPSDETRYVGQHKRRLWVHFLRRRTERLELENRSGSARSVYVGLRVVKNAKVSGASQIDFDSARGRVHAVFELPARTKREYTLKIEEGLSRSVLARELTSRQFAEMAQSSAMPSAQRKALKTAGERVQQAEVRAAALAKRRGELKALIADTRRLREHIRVVSAKAESDLAKRLLDTEDAIRRKRARIAALATEITTLRNQAYTALEQLPED